MIGRFKENMHGQRSVTSAPVIVAKPDLRHYNRRASVVPDDVELRRDYAVRRRRAGRATHTRWKVTTGVVDRYGDDLRVYTGACQGCGRWFRVERYPGNVSARWPRFCSEDCRTAKRALTKRQSARRRRAGQTTGGSRPEVFTFDPAAVEAPYFLADEIVRGRVTSSPTAYADALDYIALVPEDTPDHWSDRMIAVPLNVYLRNS